MNFQETKERITELLNTMRNLEQEQSKRFTALVRVHLLQTKGGIMQCPKCNDLEKELYTRREQVETLSTSLSYFLDSVRQLLDAEAGGYHEVEPSKAYLKRVYDREVKTYDKIYGGNNEAVK